MLLCVFLRASEGDFGTSGFGGPGGGCFRPENKPKLRALGTATFVPLVSAFFLSMRAIPLEGTLGGSRGGGGGGTSSRG